MLRPIYLAALLMTAVATSTLCASECHATPLRHEGVSIDLLVVYKKQRRLAFYSNTQLVGYYDIALGSQPEGAKHFEGDGRTPEGNYKIIEKRIHPLFYKSLKISYPNKKDIAYARAHGRSPGGEILIHGIKKPYGFVGTLQDWIDWTQGCVAVTNAEMDVLFEHVQVGTPVYIRAQ